MKSPEKATRRRPIEREYLATPGKGRSVPFASFRMETKLPPVGAPLLGHPPPSREAESPNESGAKKRTAVKPERISDRYLRNRRIQSDPKYGRVAGVGSSSPQQNIRLADDSRGDRDNLRHAEVEEMAEVHGNRTHQPRDSTRLYGFEDRGRHQPYTHFHTEKPGILSVVENRGRFSTTASYNRRLVVGQKDRDDHR